MHAQLAMGSEVNSNSVDVSLYAIDGEQK